MPGLMKGLGTGALMQTPISSILRLNPLFPVCVDVGECPLETIFDHRNRDKSM